MKEAIIALAASAVIAAGLAFNPALAQTSALKGHNSNAPVDVAADRIEVQDRADRAVFSGNVQVRQSDLTLSAARLTVAYSNAGGIQIERLDASGGVTVRSPSETARGQYAIYDLNRRIITMIGDVTLTRGDSNVKGGRLVLDLDSGRAVMDGAGPAGTANQGGRVTGTFTVPQRRY
ncbi:LptA/OstA family protein [Sphingosinicella rhizophila]|uniref:LptA/OstA family protein n=1 Tax=Sphingosinicella rhizophila TaxID=3050082 RepID=A0ABU3Q7R1_9SPHN|nr:LptA/OstA family protein [Sphingosinicella sp. GR2756]MDT9599444.1 LptA/OstA family protein [Sphingosinicella sp. GR2756]